MIVLSEASPQLPDSASLRDIQRATEAARFAGCQVYSIVQDLPEGISMDDAMWHIPSQPHPTPAIWIGYIPLPAHYETVYQAALAKNIRFLNTPAEFRRAEEFDQFYPFIADLTAKSFVTSSVTECLNAAEILSYPVFLKGTIQSLKADGPSACIAHNPEQLSAISSRLLQHQRRSLGKVIVRSLIHLRHVRKSPQGFPLGREYRIFVCHSQIVGMGYYWEGDDALTDLSASERTHLESLAIQVSQRLQVPYIAIDIGQTSDGEWIVIEVGDGQFSGLSQVPIHALWSALVNAYA